MIPFQKLAFKCGYRHYKRFAFEHPADFRQTAALAALTVPTGASDNDAYRAISRLFRKAVSQYGYRLTDADGWQPVGRGPAPTDGTCGLPDCPDAGVYRDARYGKLCRRHRQQLRHRKVQGLVDPYASLIPQKAGGQKSVLLCDWCSQSFERAVSSIRGRENQYCCGEHYYKSRYRKLLITDHAIARFQERVAPLPSAQVRAEMERAFRAASLYDYRGGVLRCTGKYEFRAVLGWDDAAEEPCVITIYESESANFAKRDLRAERRAT